MAADEQQNGDEDERPFFFFDAPSSGFAELVQEERERAVRRQHRHADDEAKQQHRFAFHAPTCEDLGADFCGRWSYWSCGRQRGADGQEHGWNHVVRLLIKAAGDDQQFEYRLLIGEQLEGDNDYPVGCFYRCDGRATVCCSTGDVSLWSDSIASYRHPNPPLVLSISQRQPVLTVRLEADGQLLVLAPFPQQEWAAAVRLERRPCSCHCPDSPTSRFG